MAVAKVIAQLDVHGKLKGIFMSSIQAAKATNITQVNISSATRGERKQAGGYVWKVVEINELGGELVLGAAYCQKCGKEAGPNVLFKACKTCFGIL